MSTTHALELSFSEKSETRISLLVRGIFWPFWPLRGRVNLDVDSVFLKLPKQQSLSLGKNRIHSFIFDYRGAGVFVFLRLQDEPVPEEPAAEETETEEVGDQEPSETTEAAAPKPKPKAAAKPAGKKKAEPEPEPEPEFEKKYLGLFSKPSDAEELMALLQKLDFQIVKL